MTNLEKIKRDLERLENAIKKRKKKWIEGDIVELLSELSLLGMKEGAIKKPQMLLEKADNLLDKWYEEKHKIKKKYLGVKDLYKSWAKEYDTDVNLAIFLEEKQTKKIFRWKNKDILDLGCGTGRYAISLAKKNNVTALDFSKEMLKIAKNKAKKQKVKINFKQGDIVKYKPKQKYDIILSMLVQDHIKDIKPLINVIGKASKIGTELFITNMHPYHTYKAVVLNNSRGQIRFTQTTNQYYHPLEEYLKLLGKKGFILVGYKDIIFEGKYKKIKKFEYLHSMLHRPVSVLYRFKKK